MTIGSHPRSVPYRWCPNLQSDEPSRDCQTPCRFLPGCENVKKNDVQERRTKCKTKSLIKANAHYMSCKYAFVGSEEKLRTHYNEQN